MNRIDDDKKRKVLRYRWVCLAVLWLVYFFVYFDRVAPAIVAPELMTEFGISAAAMGLLSAAYFYPYAAMQIPSGILSDFLGPRLAVTIFFIIAGIGTVMFGMASSYNVAIVGRVLMGVGVAVVYIPIMKIQAQWFRPHEFATLTGILLTVGNIGALGAAAPLAAFVGSHGWRPTFYYLGVASVVLAILVFAFVRNRPRDMGLPTIEEVDGIVLSPEAHAAEESITFKQTMHMAVTNRNFWWLAIFAFVVYGPMMGFQGLWAIPYMENIMGFTKQQAGNVISWWAIGMIVGCPLSGYLSDRVFKARKLPTLIGSVLYTLGWLYLAMSPSGWSLTSMSAFCFFMGGFGGFYVINYAHVGERLPRKVVGTAIGVFNLFYFIGGAVYQQVMGQMLDGYGKVNGAFPVEAYVSTFWLCFIGMVIGVAALLMTTESFIRRDVPAAAPAGK